MTNLLTVLVAGRATTVEVAKVSESGQQTGSGSPSAGYRLVLAAQGPHADQRAWILEHLPGLLATVAERRAFATAAFQQADATSIRDHARLSATEQAWLLMWLAHNLGEDAAALDYLSQLPPAGYPDKVGIIAAHWGLASDVPYRQLVINQLVSMEEHPLAATLLFALDRRPWEHPQRGLVSGLLPAPGVRFDEHRLADLEQWAENLDPSTTTGAGWTPLRSIASALGSGKWPPGAPPIVRGGTDGEVSDWGYAIIDAAARAGESVLDDLIDHGLLPRRAASLAAANPACDAVYVWSRMDPGSLSGPELTSLGGRAELARRTFLEGGKPDSDDPDSRLFMLLAAFRAGDMSVLAELIPLLPERHRPVALAVGRSFRDQSIDLEALVDRSTWPLLRALLPNGEALRQAAPGVRRLSEWTALEDAQRLLYEWDWTGAAEAARTCLRTAEDEAVRDEALNLLAAALYQAGKVDAAHQALEDALAGADSAALIVNYGIVAGEQDKQSASTELARLAVEAPSLELRLAAARRALALWNDHVPGVGQSDDPPTSLVSAMRGLSVEPTGLEEHTLIMRFLSWADRDWLGDERHTKGSPYADSPQHRYMVARARGFDEAQASLAELSASYPGEEWLATERSAMAESWIQVLLTTEEPLPGLGMCGLNFLDAGAELDNRQSVLLSVLSVRELLMYMLSDESTGTPKEALLNRLIAARKIVAADPTLDDEAFGGLIDETTERFALASWKGWAIEHDAIIDAYNSIIDRVGGLPRRQVNWVAVRRATAPMVAALTEMDAEIQQLLRLQLRPETSEGLQNLLGGARQLRDAVVRLSA